MTFLIALAVLLGFASTVFFIWLTVIAFRQSVVWGLVTFFVPFGNVVFAVKYWEDSKKPFLSGLACSVLSVILLFGGVAVGTAQMKDQLMNDPEFQQAMHDLQFEGGEATEGETVSMGMPSGSSTASVQTGAAVPDSRPSAVVRQQTTPAERAPLVPMKPASTVTRNKIRVRQAADHVGARLRIVGHTRMDTVARLVGVEGDRLQFEQDLGGGVVTFEMGGDEIKSLELLR